MDLLGKYLIEIEVSVPTEGQKCKKEIDQTLEESQSEKNRQCVTDST